MREGGSNLPFHWRSSENSGQCRSEILLINHKQQVVKRAGLPFSSLNREKFRWKLCTLWNTLRSITHGKIWRELRVFEWKEQAVWQLPVSGNSNSFLQVPSNVGKLANQGKSEWGNQLSFRTSTKFLLLVAWIENAIEYEPQRNKTTNITRPNIQTWPHFPTTTNLKSTCPIFPGESTMATGS